MSYVGLATIQCLSTPSFADASIAVAPLSGDSTSHIPSREKIMIFSPTMWKLSSHKSACWKPYAATSPNASSSVCFRSCLPIRVRLPSQRERPQYQTEREHDDPSWTLEPLRSITGCGSSRSASCVSYVLFSLLNSLFLWSFSCFNTVLGGALAQQVCEVVEDGRCQAGIRLGTQIASRRTLG